MRPMAAQLLLLTLITCAAIAAAAALIPSAGSLSPLTPFRSKTEATETWKKMEEALRVQGPGSMKALFAEFKKKYHFTFANPAEDTIRYSIFEKNVRRIIAINKDPTARHWAGLTRFAVMEPKEARAHLIHRHFIPKKRPQPQVKVAAKAAMEAALPLPSKDWEAEGKMTPVKDQGNCGSCWALTGVAAIEARIKIQTGRDYDLSEQQVLDCHPSAWACWGGWLNSVYTYAASTPLVSDALYNYTVGGCFDPLDNTNDCFANRCPTNLCRTCKAGSIPSGPRFQLTGNAYAWAAAGSVDAYAEAVALKGPVAVAMLVSDDFFLYSGGVYTKPEGTCGDLWAVDHAVLLVGYDSTGTQPYWKLRNTWGPYWGEAGYFRMSMEPGTVGPCNIYQYGGYIPMAVNMTDRGVQITSLEPKVPLRLVQGTKNSATSSTISQGRLEVQRNGSYGTVCNGQFTHAAASVSCSQMGKGSVGYATAPSVFGSAAPDVTNWMSNVRCSGTEGRLQDCIYPGWGLFPCGHTQDVGVYCGYFKVQLLYPAGTPTTNRIYRVEAKINDIWGTACANSFTDADATVLCRSAGLSSAGRAVRLSVATKPPSGPASQPIFIDSPGCTGTEAALQLCRLPKLLGDQSCPTDHSGDVGVQCYNLPGVATPAATSTAYRPAVVAI